jgi:hypothetical protein
VWRLAIDLVVAVLLTRQPGRPLFVPDSAVAHGDLIYRRALLLHPPGGSLADMIKQSDIFRFDKLKEERRKDYLSALQLARQRRNQFFPDPILKFAKKLRLLNAT